jgi:hypothetical protein
MNLTLSANDCSLGDLRHALGAGRTAGIRSATLQLDYYNWINCLENACNGDAAGLH